MKQSELTQCFDKLKQELRAHYRPKNGPRDPETERIEQLAIVGLTIVESLLVDIKRIADSLEAMQPNPFDV